MLFKENEQFSIQEELLLKIMLSGIHQSELLELLPHRAETIYKITSSLDAKRVNKDQELESYLRNYESIVSEKHKAARMQNYKEAARLRDIEKDYADLSYQWLFTDDFSIQSRQRSYVRYTSEYLIQEFESQLAL